MNEDEFDIADIDFLEYDEAVHVYPTQQSNRFKVGDMVKQDQFLGVPRQGKVVSADPNGYTGVKLGKLVYGFLDYELTLVPSHKEFTDEEYESLLV